MADVNKLIRDEERSVAATRAVLGRPVMRLKDIQRVDPFEAPHSRRPKYKLNPRLAAGGDREALRQGIVALRHFRDSDRRAWGLVQHGHGVCRRPLDRRRPGFRFARIELISGLAKIVGGCAWCVVLAIATVPTVVVGQDKAKPPKFVPVIVDAKQVAGPGSLKRGGSSDRLALHWMSECAQDLGAATKKPIGRLRLELAITAEGKVGSTRVTGALANPTRQRCLKDHLSKVGNFGYLHGQNGGPLTYAWTFEFERRPKPVEIPITCCGGRTCGEREHSTATPPKVPSKGQILDAMKSVEADVQQCNEGTDVRGVAIVALEIRGETGQVTTAQVRQVNDAVAACIERAVRSIRFPKFSDDTFSVTFPYRLN